MINNVIRAYHDTMAHCGYDKTLQGIYTNYWFPTMRKRVRDYISNCITCLMANSSTHSKEGEIQLQEEVATPFDTLYLDHFGPLPETENGYKYILVIVDSFTRFTWLSATKSTGTKEVIGHLNILFATFSNPKRIVTDRGTAFTSNEFANFVKIQNIKHRQVAVAAPWANGKVERVNRFLKSSLKKLIDEPRDWKSHLSTAQYVLNNTVHSAIKMSPSKLFLGYELRNQTDAVLTEFLNSLIEADSNIVTEREVNRNVAVEAAKKLANYNKLYYDSRHNPPTKYQPGDYVLIRDSQTKPNESRKLKPNYKGPYVITKILNKNRYVVEDIPGFNITAKAYNSILSPDRLKPWVKPVVNNC